jgi:(1->4)-alpha-D-glucan 1-alpha-D-glucosylmutase
MCRRLAPPPEELLAHRHDGRVKLFATSRALTARTQCREAYEQGEYIPLQASGARRDCVFAFARRFGDAVAITCVPRMVASVIPDASAAPVGPVWLDTRIELPASEHSAYDRSFRNVFTDEVVQPEAGGGPLTIPAATLFARFPVALLLPCSTF